MIFRSDGYATAAATIPDISATARHAPTGWDGPDAPRHDAWSDARAARNGPWHGSSSWHATHGSAWYDAAGYGTTRYDAHGAAGHGTDAARHGTDGPARDGTDGPAWHAADSSSGESYDSIKMLFQKRVNLMMPVVDKLSEQNKRISVSRISEFL